MRTRYQPVGLPVLPSLSWEVRMMRTLGAIVLVAFSSIVQGRLTFSC